jgi:uncharacterized protein
MHMKHPPMHPHSPFRIFAFSALATLATLVGVLWRQGGTAMMVAFILILVEVAFSFDNAILNAKVLAKLSPFWQRIFLTIGALVAIFGMRLVFPVVIVALTAGIGWHEVVNLALHHPHQYAEKLEAAHPAIAAFGGAFLLILALDFFTDQTHQVMWLTRVERSMAKLARNWAPPFITLSTVVIVSSLPFNHHPRITLIAGALGILVYSTLHGITEGLAKIEGKRAGTTLRYTGMLAFLSFLYLEVLDASFSFDGVIGAFVVTQDVVLIALGLGVGALWVRSLTVFMVRRGTLEGYKYVEHGAHYTIGMLSVLLFVSEFVDVPQAIAGLSGLSIIAASVIASRQAMNESKRRLTKRA